MDITLPLFYIFSFVLISSALAVITARNTVHSVMFLILAFFNAAALFIIIGAEFLAMLLVVVYVGAIAVLFLFVVMMLNVDNEKIVKEISSKKPILALVGIILLVEIVLISQFSEVNNFEHKKLFPTPEKMSNAKAIGSVLYTDFILPFQLSGAILFVAMIGAIVLTLKPESKRLIKKQDIYTQVTRTKKDSVEIVKVKTGEGINI
jgi:NADH-quinone oxidoreductase subunit J